MHAFWICLTFLLAACGGSNAASQHDDAGVPQTAKSLVVAGGCFWCVESDFEKMEGVYEAVSGYSGGELKDATYRNHEGHREVVQVYYDPKVTNYAALIHDFLRTIDVVDAGGQFCDRGHSYTTAVHYKTDAERKAALAAIAEAEEYLGKSIATPVEELRFFVKAEDYHQDYYKKNPIRYGFYRNNCGRDRRVKALWGDEAIEH